MKKIILILIIVFNTNSFGQKVYPRTEKQYYANGKLFYTGKINYRNLPSGEWKYYYPNGQLKSIGKYDGNGEYYGTRTGKWKEYHENGQLSSKCKYKDNKLIGKCKSYYENGNIKAIKYYNKYGDNDGVQKSYHKNGQVEEIKNFKDGSLTGKYVKYFEDGRIEEIGEYNDYDKIGEWKLYFKNGKIKELGSYKNGNKTGVWTETIDSDSDSFIFYNLITENNLLNLDDEIQSIANYENDEITLGKIEYYSLNGNYIGYVKLWFDSNDNPKGEFKLYYPDKSLLSEGVFSEEENGFININIYDKSGSIIKKNLVIKE